MENLLQQTNYPMKNKYNDAESNRLLNYWLLLDERGSLIQDLTGESLETVLYSKYYWSSRLIDRYTSLYGSDSGLEQCRYKILDEIMPPQRHKQSVSFSNRSNTSQSIAPWNSRSI